MSVSPYPRPCPTLLFKALGQPQSPLTLRQDAFDDPELLRLLSRHPGLGTKMPDGPLQEYCLSLRYAPHLDPDLMRHAIPLLFEAWQESLFEEHRLDTATAIHSALIARPNAINDTIGSAASAAIMDFMRASIVARISVEQSLRKQARDSSTHTWLAFFATYGCIWSNIERIFAEWRKLSLVGLSLSAIQYLSLFAYEDREHPLFPAWSPTLGGGAPRPWHYAAEDAVHPKWTTENLSALKSFLTAVEVGKWASDAALRLGSHPESDLARLVCSDIELQPYRVESRIADLMRHLASTEPYKYWSDEYGMSST